MLLRLLHLPLHPTSASLQFDNLMKKVSDDPGRKNLLLLLVHLVVVVLSSLR